MVIITDMNIPEFIESHDWAKKLFLTHTSESKYFLNNDTTQALSHIFSVALKSFKSSPSTIDLIHRNILDYIPNNEEKIKIFTYFLQHFNDITLDTQNEIGGLNLTQYYHQIIDEILAPKHLDACSYDCLSAIARFNAFIIENKLPEVFKKILHTKKVTNEEKASYIVLLSEILNACSRLRRETKLIPWILIAINKNSKRKSSHFDVNEVLPNLFLDKFSNTVSSMTNSQIMKLLMSFIYHLDIINTQSSAESTSLITIQIASKLIIAFFDGVHIFDNSTLSMQQKFVNGLSKFGEVLEKLITFTSTINDIFMVSVLKIINSWESVVALIKKYASDAFTESSMSSILKSIQHIHQVIDSKSLSHWTDQNLVKFFVCCKLEERKIHDKPPLIENDLEILRNIENYWEILFEKYPYLLLHFNNSQIESLACLLINNTQFSEAKILKFTLITHIAVQNNEKLVNELIFLILCNIYTKLNDSSNITKNLLKIITKKKWESKRMEKIFANCKDLLLNELLQWTQIEDESINFIVKYLQILLILPLIHISVELRTLIFLVIFAIGKESEKSKEIIDICSQILSDISENGNIDILQYIQPEYLINELPKYPSIIKLLRYSLRNVSNYQRVETFIKNNKSIENCAAPILIHCIESIKPRLKANEKRIARKMEKKLSKRVLKALESGVKTSYQVKSLTAAVKVAIVSKKVDDSLLEKINSTLDKIFEISNKKLNVTDDLKDANPLVEEGLELIKLILLHQSHIPIDKKISKCIWSLMLKNTSEDIVKNLFSVTNPKLLKKVLILLQKQIVSALKIKDESLLKNSLQIWCSVAHANMSIRSNIIRHKYLQAFLRYFYTSTIPSDHHLTILKICELSIRAKKSQLPEKTIDLILMIVNNFINDPVKLTVNLCEEILEICSAFGRFRTSIMTDRLPALLYIYRRVLRFIINEARKHPSSKQRELECLSLNAQKLTTIFVKLKKDIARISPYTIADLIEVYSEGVIPVYIKEPLNDCISMFFSICDQHAVSLLLRTLPISMQEIFKTLYSAYNKFYKFTGKI